MKSNSLDSSGIRQIVNKRSTEILLYVPNLIGYARLFLLCFSYFFWNQPRTFLLLYTASVSLDFFDGITARKLNQCSAFGAWLDVVIDNLSRGMLWTNLFQWGWLVLSLEWVTFVANHSGRRGKWQDLKDVSKAVESPPPQFVQLVMANGFKTPIGALTILGLHCLPMWIYVMQANYFPTYIPYFLSLLVCLILVAGRVLCMACELWCVQNHIKSLLLEDTPEILGFGNQNGDYPDQNTPKRLYTQTHSN